MYGLKLDFPEFFSYNSKIDMTECLGDSNWMLLRVIYLTMQFYLAISKVIS